MTIHLVNRVYSLQVRHSAKLPSMHLCHHPQQYSVFLNPDQQRRERNNTEISDNHKLGLFTVVKLIFLIH